MLHTETWFIFVLVSSPWLLAFRASHNRNCSWNNPLCTQERAWVSLGVYNYSCWLGEGAVPCYRQYSSICLFINSLNFLDSCLRDSLVVVPLSSDITSHPWLCSSAIFARCKYYAQRRLQVHPSEDRTYFSRSQETLAVSASKGTQAGGSLIKTQCTTTAHS